MRKYNLKQDFEITEENGQAINSLNLQVYLREEGICEDKINSIFESMAYSFSKIIGEQIGVSNEKEQEESNEPVIWKEEGLEEFENGLQNFRDEKKNIKKGWFK